MSDINSYLSQGTRFMRNGENFLDQAGDTLGALGLGGATQTQGITQPTGTTQRTVTQARQGAHSPVATPTNPSSTSVLSSGTQIIDGKRYFINPAPKGTRLIIPARLSSTGQERYIGAHVMESITNMNNKNPKCANVIVFDTNNKPSSTFYDFGPNGEIFLKGTTTQIQFDQKDPPVQLSEAEYISIIQSLNQHPAEITYFKTTAAKGDAENSTASSPGWFSRNWWKILLGLAISAGIAWGGIAIYNHKNEKDEKKERTTASTTANQTSVSSINEQAIAQTTASALSSAQNITNQTNSQLTLTNNNSNSM